MSTLIKSTSIPFQVIHSAPAPFLAHGNLGSKSVKVIDVGADELVHRLWYSHSTRLVKEVAETQNEPIENEGFTVDHSNPFEVDYGKEPVTHIFSYQNLFGSLSSRGKFRGFHGTSLQSLKEHGIEQIFDKEFNPKGRRIYFDSIGTAIEYALKHNIYDAGGDGWGPRQLKRAGTELKAEDGAPCLLINQPVVLAISSDETPSENDPVKEPHLHKYHYFSGKNPVHIDGMWLLHHNANEDSEIKKGIGLGSSQRIAAMAQRKMSNAVKFY